jgi:hypothetical protein
MPVPPAELTAEYSIEGPDEARAAALDAAAPSGLAREAGPGVTALSGRPGVTALSGSREEVLVALRETVLAALDAGAWRFEIKLEAPTE